MEYNQALAAGTINNTNVTLYEYATGTYLTPTLSLVGNGQVINIAPTSNLVAGSQYQVYISHNDAVTNTDSVAVQTLRLLLHSGHGGDTGCTHGYDGRSSELVHQYRDQRFVSVNFNKAINPVSVTGSTIQVSGGSVTEVPSSISFTPDYTRTIVVPQAPLPSSTQMTIAISGVTSEAGVAVASQTTNFTTMAGADFIAPYVINSSVQ